MNIIENLPLMIVLALITPIIQVLIFLIPQIKERKFNLNQTVMLIISIFVWIMPIYIIWFSYHYDDLFLQLYFNLAFYPTVILGFITGISTAIVHLFRKSDWLIHRKRLLTEKIYQKKDSVFRDMLRKAFHMLFFVAIFVALRLTIMDATNRGYFEYHEYYGTDYTLEKNILGIVPEILVLPWDWYGKVGTFQVVMAYALLITAYVISWIDMIRRTDVLYMPIKHTMLRFLREKELDNTCSSVEMTMGLTLACLFLPPLPMLAISYIIVMSDTFASQVGMRLGKNKIPWNGKKSVQGTLAGLLVSFGTIIFVGPIWGFIAAFIFVFVDVITEEPIPLSDNLMYAIFGLGFYYFLAFLGVPYTYFGIIFGL